MWHVTYDMWHMTLSQKRVKEYQDSWKLSHIISETKNGTKIMACLSGKNNWLTYKDDKTSEEESNPDTRNDRHILGTGNIVEIFLQWGTHMCFWIRLRHSHSRTWPAPGLRKVDSGAIGQNAFRWTKLILKLRQNPSKYIKFR